jgi:hypothetical protein
MQFTIENQENGRVASVENVKSLHILCSFSGPSNAPTDVSM